ncbi:MAG TPA: hypothetical protein VJ827_13325 [Rubrobacter sp.]|nr:hypothetical protein [Rubrobacter sp.]
MSVDRNRMREPDLTKLRDLLRAEAIRVAMLVYGWDATTAAEKVDTEQGRYKREIGNRYNPESV